MNKDSKIYVAGHTGLVGSAITRMLLCSGYKNLVLRTHKELDLTARGETEAFFKEQRPEYVFLAAAKVGGILANDTYPADFIYQNLMIQTNVIDLAYQYKVRKLLFLGSSCIYPKLCRQPIKEEFLLSGYIEQTNEPYAIAKIAGIKMCQSYNRQFGTDFISVIPANAYGINDYFGEGGHVVSALMKKFHEAETYGYDSVEIWGTGKPKREFLYVDDLADACVFLMNAYRGNDPINIGRGETTSIKMLAKIIQRITGFEGRVLYDKTRPDGMPKRLLDTTKIKAMGWKADTELEKGLRLTYEWYRNFAGKRT